MDKNEFLAWFRAQVESRWPTWQVNACIVADWFTALRRYDAETLTEAVRRHKLRDDLARPKINKVLALARAHAGDRRPGAPEPTTNVFIECIEAPPGRPNLVGHRKPVYVNPPAKHCDPDCVRAGAESMRRRFEEIYGGRYITVVTEPPVDDGLRGEPARRRACERILNGPDTPGQRSLLQIQAAATERDRLVPPRGPP